jgi:toxin ParE1/3/4
MAHRVAWSHRAVQDLESIATFIAVDSPAFASVVVRKIVGQTRTLAEFPKSGRKVPEFDDESFRELVVYSYRIIYQLQAEQVLIAAVIHGKRILQ